jgi:hypothetical protein
MISFLISDQTILDRLHIKGLFSGGWRYYVTLIGNKDVYNKEDIHVRTVGGQSDPLFSEIIFAGGSIQVNTSEGTVHIDLVIDKDGKNIPFVGNGSYSISEKRM